MTVIPEPDPQYRDDNDLDEHLADDVEIDSQSLVDNGGDVEEDSVPE